MQLRNQFRGQFYAAGVNFKTPLVNAALAGFKVKVFAGGVQIDDAAATVFQFFKAAESALFAKVVPLITVICRIVHIAARIGNAGRAVNGMNKETLLISYLSAAFLCLRFQDGDQVRNGFLHGGLQSILQYLACQQISILDTPVGVFGFIL